MGHTKENSATYLLVSNFKGSMKLNRFVRYLGLNIELSKSAIIEDGTHKIFKTPSVKVDGEPDMFICDEKEKVLILIENKISINRGLSSAQESEDGYTAIIKDYLNDGYNAHLIFLVPEGYLQIQKIYNLIKNHNEYVHVITWDKFFDNFDNDKELEPIKRALQAIEIDGIDLEEDFFNNTVDFSLVSPTIIKNVELVDNYLAQLIYDACAYSQNGRKSLWKGDNTGDWQRPRIKNWASELGYTDYCDSPCVEIKFQDDKNYYMVAGYDYIQQRFCVYIRNYTNDKTTVEYCNEIQLPLGLTKSYYAIKDKYCEQLHDFIQKIQSSARTNKNLK